MGGGNTNTVVFDTATSGGKLIVNMEEIDVSASDSTMTTSASATALTVGAGSNTVVLSTNSNGKLDLNLDALELGDDDAFTINRPASSGAGTDLTISGQDAGGTGSAAGGSVKITAGAGASGGDGADVVLQAGALSGGGSDGDVLIKDGQGNTKLSVVSSSDTLKIENANIDLSAKNIVVQLDQNEASALVFKEGNTNVLKLDTDTIASTTTTSGAVQVTGGVGVSGQVTAATVETGTVTVTRGTVDLTNANTAITTGTDAAALTVGGNTNTVVFDTATSGGKLIVNMEEIDVSASDSTMTTSASATALTVGAGSNTVVLSTNSNGKLDLNLDALELGDDDAFTINRPASSGAGTDLTISGQDAGGLTTAAGGSVKITAGAGASGGDGGDVVLQAGENSDVLIKDGQGSTKLLMSSAGDAFSVSTLNTNLNGNVNLGDATADQITVTGKILGENVLKFEGDTNDGNILTLAVADPTTSETVTLPAETGTVLTTASTGSSALTGVGTLGSLTVSGQSNLGVFKLTKKSEVASSSISVSMNSESPTSYLTVTDNADTADTNGLTVSNAVDGQVLVIKNSDAQAVTFGSYTISADE